MRKLFSTIIKETLLLVRDIPGLTILFVMPVFLIIIITIFQENAFRRINESKITILFVDNDKSILSQTIEKGLKNSEYFEIKKKSQGYKINELQAKNAIAKGDFQIGIIIPKDATKKAIKRARILIEDSLSNNETISNSLKRKTQLTDVIIYFDPAIRDSYRNSIVNSLKRLVQNAEIKIMMDSFKKILPDRLNNQLKQSMGQYAPENLKFNISFPWKSESLIMVKEIFAKSKTAIIKPTVVQKNVPAFALFAMFFIVIPISGSLISERNQGAYNRLRTLPVSYFTLLSGKTIVYTMVCLIQFVLMLLVGILILPAFFGMPTLEMGSHYGAIIVMSLSSALAAIGFGLIVGTLATTHAQASMFGSVMIIILAILGGTFLPVYLMPEPLKIISIISPIRWGIDGFIDIFVREGSIVSIMPNVIRLILFFCIAQAISLFNFVKRN